MKVSKKELNEFIEKPQSEGLIIDRCITGDAVARHFGIPRMAGRQLVDAYLRGDTQ